MVFPKRRDSQRQYITPIPIGCQQFTFEPFDSRVAALIDVTNLSLGADFSKAVPSVVGRGWGGGLGYGVLAVAAPAGDPTDVVSVRLPPVIRSLLQLADVLVSTYDSTSGVDAARPPKATALPSLELTVRYD